MQKFIRNPWSSEEKSNKVDKPSKFEEKDKELYGCGHGVYPPHTCPFQEELNGDYQTLCTCCPDCANECLMDI